MRNRPLFIKTGKSRAFTLVELLVVIGIIALLMAILLPALAKARQAANETKCQTNIRQLALGFLMYCDANHGLFPGDGGDGTTTTPLTQTDGPYGTTLKLTWDSGSLWWNAIPPYLQLDTYYDLQTRAMTSGQYMGLPNIGSNSIYICPALSYVAPASQDTSGGVTVALNCFKDHGTEAGTTATDQVRPVCICYVINSKLNATQLPNMSTISYSSTTALVVERRMAPGEIPPSDPNYSTDYKKNLSQLKCDFDRCTLRHRGGGFVGYCDGHVGYYTYDQLQIPRNVSTGIDYNYPNSLIWDPYAPLTKD